MRTLVLSLGIVLGVVSSAFSADDPNRQAKKPYTDYFDLVKARGETKVPNMVAAEVFFMKAVKEGLYSAVENGLKSGRINVNATDPLGRTALFYAIENNQLEILKLLLDNEANPNLPDDTGNVPIHTAVAEGKWEAFEILVGGGAYLNVENHAGDTPLCLAVALGYDRMVDLLLEKGADPKVKSHRWESLLSVAIKKGWTYIIGRLLEEGVELESDDIELARNWEQQDIVQLLEEHYKARKAGEAGIAQLAESVGELNLSEERSL